jgi:zinc transport system substrate-binding protein
MVLIRKFGVVVAVAALLAGCGGPSKTTGKTTTAGGGKAKVVAAFYPLAEAARRVGGTHVQVEDLTPAGAEPHDLELRPSQVDDVHNADAVVIMGTGFQPSVERAARRRPGGRGVLEVLPAVLGDQGRRSGVDPHVWLDPVLMQAVIGQVHEALAAVLPASARPDLDANASRYRELLTGLDDQYRAGLAQCARKEIVTTHEAFGRLAARYGLTQEAIAGLSPEAEPTPARIAELADLVRSRGVTTVFTEELVSPRVAQALAREAHVRTDVLSPIEGLTSAERQAGDNYVSLMDRNLAKLRAALGCA